MSDAITLDLLAHRLSQRGATLAHESAVFIALEALEQLGTRAAVLTASEVLVSPEGTVSVGPNLDFALDETAVLEGVLETLDAVLPATPVGLTELAVKVRAGEIISRGAMLSELAAMLVPFNRKAARRMVARLVREASRTSATATTSSLDAQVTAAMLQRETDRDAPVASASDTLVDGTTLEAHGALRTSLEGRLPDDWGDDGNTLRRRSAERRRAWVAMAVAAVALVAAAVFLVERVRGASA